MKITLRTGITGSLSARTGETVDVDDEFATRLIERHLAEPAEFNTKVELVDDTEVRTQGSAKRGSKKKAK